MLVAGANHAQVSADPPTFAKLRPEALGDGVEDLFAELDNLLRASFAMHCLVGGLAILVHLKAVYQARGVFDQPSKDRMVGWQSGLDSGFEGRLERAKLVFDGQNSSFGSAVAEDSWSVL